MPEERGAVAENARETDCTKVNFLICMVTLAQIKSKKFVGALIYKLLIFKGLCITSAFLTLIGSTLDRMGMTNRKVAEFTIST